MAAGTLAPLDDVDAPAPTMAPIQGAPPPLAGASPSQPAAPGAGAAPLQELPQGTPGQAPATPGAAPAQTPGGIEDQPQKKQIPTGPKVKFDPDKLAKVQTTLDLMNAMTPKSSTAYMDWWEKQHGDIDDRYSALQKDLGARPEDEQDYSRKEKFAALLEFGLHLMKASATPSTNQGGALLGTLSDSVDKAQAAHTAGIQAQQSQAIEDAKQEELKGIGTPAAAMKQQADMNRQDIENLKDRASAYKDVSASLDEDKKASGPKTYSTGKDGALYSLEPDENGNPVAKPVLGIDGKPFTGRVLGRESGSGVDKGDTAAIRNQKYLTGVLGVDANTATQIAFRPTTGNALKDHAAVYKSVLSATMGDTDKAKMAADQYIIDNYGAGELSRATAPVVPPRGAGGAAVTPPPSALQGLKPGMVRDFGANGKWTVGIDGTPQRVGASAPLAQ
jgi:hypothetical protein